MDITKENSSDNCMMNGCLEQVLENSNSFDKFEKPVIETNNERVIIMGEESGKMIINNFIFLIKFNFICNFYQLLQMIPTLTLKMIHSTKI